MEGPKTEPPAPPSAESHEAPAAKDTPRAVEAESEIEPARPAAEAPGEGKAAKEDDDVNDLEDLEQTAKAAMELASDVTNKASSFFSSVFSSAAKRVEKTYEKARDEIRAEARNFAKVTSPQGFNIRSPGMPNLPGDKAQDATQELRSISAGAPSVFVLLHPASHDVFVVGEERLSVFSVAGVKLHDRPLKLSPDEQGDAGRAVCGLFYKTGNYIVVGSSDGLIRCYSCAEDSSLGTMVRESPPVSTVTGVFPTSVALVDDKCLAAGLSNGSIALVSLESLETSVTVPPPEACQSDASPLYVTSLDRTPLGYLAAGFSDGVVATLGPGAKSFESATVAHCEQVLSAVSVLRGLLVASVGFGDVDQCLSIVRPSTGATLCRHYLGFKVLKLYAVRDGEGDTSKDAGESTLVACGANGMLVVLSVLPLSTERVGVKIAVEIAPESRGSGSRMDLVSFDGEGGMLATGAADGVVRVWQLSRADARTLTCQQLSEVSEPDLESAKQELDPAREPTECSTRVAGLEETVATQKVMSLVLQDDVQLEERQKDELVSEFQRLQSEAQEAATKYDGDFVKARDALSRRLGWCFSAPDGGDKLRDEFASAGKRAALLDYFRAKERHQKRIHLLALSLAETYGDILLEQLEYAAGSPDVVEAARTAVTNLSGIRLSEAMTN